MEQEKANNTILRDKLEDANEHQGTGGENNPNAHEMIPRPAGTNFSIQVEMGLLGNTKKCDKYKAIQVCPNNMA